jgi:hypothetical protein
MSINVDLLLVLHVPKAFTTHPYLRSTRFDASLNPSTKSREYLFGDMYLDNPFGISSISLAYFFAFSGAIVPAEYWA